MQTEMKEAGDFERLLTVTIQDGELEKAKTTAARRLSKDMKIKGFRPGKAPRQLVEAMVGEETLRSEAIEDALPEVVGSALTENDIRPVTQPRVEDIRDVDGGVEVDVKVTLWPTLESVPQFKDRRVEIDAPAVSDEDIDGQLDRLRDQFAELEEVERVADEGDFILMNLTVTRNGEAIPDASADDLLYEVGSDSFLPGIDAIAVGSSAGDIKETVTTLPEGFGDHGGEAAEARILVKGVRAKKLPDITDEWVSDVTEFETVEELRRDLTDSFMGMRIREARARFREQLMQDLVDDVDITLPDALIDAEFEVAVRDMVHRLSHQGIDLGNYLRIIGKDEAEFVEEMRESAERSLKSRILLDAVIEAEEIEVDASEIDAEIEGYAAQAGEDAEEVRQRLLGSGQGEALAGDILRRKAIDVIADHAEAVDAQGARIDLTLPEVSAEIVLEDETDEEDEVDEGEDEAGTQDSYPATHESGDASDDDDADED